MFILICKEGERDIYLIIYIYIYNYIHIYIYIVYRVCFTPLPNLTIVCVVLRTSGFDFLAKVIRFVIVR